MMRTGDAENTHCCKVGRIAAQYDLSDIDDQLQTERTAGASLRDLADVFNRRVLKSAITTQTIPSLTSPDVVYDELTSTETSSGRKTELRTKLEQAGVPIETVEADFVSYVTLRSHLQECLSMETSRSPSDPETVRSGIDWIQAKAEAVIDTKLETLRGMNELKTGPLSVTQTVHVRCEECGEIYRLQQLLTETECACATDHVEPAPESSS